jgi:hypothetical protein
MTHRPRGAKPQVKGAQGSAECPTPWPAGHTLSWFRLRLDSYASKLVYKSIPCSKVSGDRAEWLASQVDGRPAIHQLQTN